VPLKTALRIALPALLVMALGLLWTGDSQRRQLLSAWEARLVVQTHHRASALVQRIAQARQMALFLAAMPPVQGLARASLHGGYDALERSPAELWRRRLQEIFTAYALSNPELIAVRYIGVADNGRELLRVDRDGQGVHAASPDRLEADGQLDYFRQAALLKSGETYVSDLHLQQLRGASPVPQQPILNAATPVYAPGGRLFGIVSISYDATDLLAELSADLPAKAQVYLTDGQGDYLINPDAARSFGFDLGQRHRWQDDFRAISTIHRPASRLHDYLLHGAVMHVVSETISYDAHDPARHFTLWLAVPDAVIAAGVAQVRNTALGLLSLGALMIAGFTWLYWQQRARAQMEEARLAAIVTSSADAIIGVTPAGVVTDWNPGAETMFGYPAREAVGQTVVDLIVPAECASEDVAVLARISHGESVLAFETVRLRRDGRRLNVSVTASPIRNREGVIVGASKTLRDVTAQRQADELLRKTQAQLATFVREAPICIAMFDRQMRYVAYSGQWLAWYGRGYSDLTGRCHYDVHPDLPEAWKAVYRQGLSGTTVHNDDDLWVRADGSKQWLRWVVQPWLDENGEIGGIIMSAEDITARKNVEEERRIAAVAFEARDGMIVTDYRGVILKINRAFSEVTGYTAADVVGKTPKLWRSGRQDAVFYRTMWEAITREGRWEGAIWNRRKDGGIHPEWLTISSVCDETGKVTHYVGIFSDIRDPKEAERKIINLAFYDSLTGLPNRRLILDRLQHALAASDRSRQFGAMLLFDLDHFKTINDTRGHDVGDRLLIDVAGRLRHALRQSDTAARLGGDEFVVLLEGLGMEAPHAATTAETIAEKLRATVAEPFLLDEMTHHVSCSMGVTLFRGQLEGVDALFKQADLALYRAKDAGRNTVRFYNPSMQAVVDARAEVETGLRRALLDNEFQLHYQPQVDVHDVVTGAEALLRWQRSGGALLSPGSFIGAAEDSGLIVPIGAWVLEAVCRQLAAWAGNAATRDLIVSINVSARQFRHADLASEVKKTLEESGADPSRLRFELTENVVLHEMDAVVKTMQQIRSLGVRFSIDDFGTGYSSLAYLRRLPLDELKIDRSFVQHLEDNVDDRAIVQAIISLGDSLDLRVIAEGVETDAQRRILAGQGCRAYQGFLFGRPCPANDIERRVERDARQTG
jgi:diguanylate cyclase (GGDEF)-like protein/PAS domain S-box-containing protein